MKQSGSINPAIQAVDVYVDIGGQSVRAIIPREVIEGCLHGSSDAASWMTSYEANAVQVDEIVRRRYAARRQDFVVVRSSDFGVWQD